MIQFFNAITLRKVKTPEVPRPPDEDWRQSPVISTPQPALGVAIGTYGAPAYVALQLEAWRRFYPHIPLLVHDDCSPEGPELQALCREKGASFATTGERHGWSLGDMAAVVAGLDWGRARNLDILVKLSRRFLICHDWTPGLQELAFSTQYATYGNACGYHDLPFRPECMGTHIETWHKSGALEEMKGHLARGCRVAPMIERWYQELALRIHTSHAPAIVKRREYFYPRDPRWGGYAVWNMMGLSRRSRLPAVFWHETCSAQDYLAFAQAWGLTQFTPADFDLPDPDAAVHDEAAAMSRRNPNYARPAL